MSSQLGFIQSRLLLFPLSYDRSMFLQYSKSKPGSICRTPTRESPIKKLRKVRASFQSPCLSIKDTYPSFCALSSNSSSVTKKGDRHIALTATPAGRPKLHFRRHIRKKAWNSSFADTPKDDNHEPSPVEPSVFPLPTKCLTMKGTDLTRKLHLRDKDDIVLPTTQSPTSNIVLAVRGSSKSTIRRRLPSKQHLLRTPSVPRGYYRMHNPNKSTEQTNEREGWEDGIKNTSKFPKIKIKVAEKQAVEEPIKADDIPKAQEVEECFKKIQTPKKPKLTLQRFPYMAGGFRSKEGRDIAKKYSKFVLERTVPHIIT